MSYILAIDVGKGTEDVMLIHEEQLSAENYENAIQLVYPSTAQLLKRKLEVIDPQDVLFFSGPTMAGEPWNKIIYTRLKQFPNTVFMTKSAALSLRYNLNFLKSKGVMILEEREFLHGLKSHNNSNHITTGDINWELLFSVFSDLSIDKSSISKILLCCQDHGRPDDVTQSVRDFRIKHTYKELSKRGKLEDLLKPLPQIPDYFPRHRAICLDALEHFNHLTQNDVLLMDSSPAVTLGAINKSSIEREFAVVVNVGNGHTLAVFLSNGEVIAVYETHTGKVNANEFLSELKQVASGKLTHEESLRRGGHGIFTRTPMEFEEEEFERFLPLVAIGPNREKIKNLPVMFAHPGGNMMMSGPIGLIKAFIAKSK